MVKYCFSQIPKSVAKVSLVIPILLSATVLSSGPVSAASSGKTTVYQKCGYDGTAVNLGVGSYTRSDLIEMGIDNNSISSVKVADSYKIRLYKGNWFAKPRLTETKNDTCLVNDGFNNNITSIEVKRDTDNDITSVPSSASSIGVLGIYDLEKYLYVAEYGVHIVATKNVTDWTIRGTEDMVLNMIGNLKTSSNRNKFQGHYVVVITDDDADIPGANEVGQKNGANSSFTYMSQDHICNTNAGPFDTVPRYREWNTPVHEFGHSIEQRLGLEDDSERVFIDENNWNAAFAGEFFASQMQYWFDADGEAGNSDGFRDDMEGFVQSYFGTYFDSDEVWTPSCWGK